MSLAPDRAGKGLRHYPARRTALYSSPMNDPTPIAEFAPLHPAKEPPRPQPAEPQREFLEQVAKAVLSALQAQDPHAYFERLARNDPELFQRWAALVLRTLQPGAPGSNSVVNVFTAIPRSPLDELPRGFQINR